MHHAKAWSVTQFCGVSREWSFVLSGISRGKVKNLKIPVGFSNKYVLNPPVCFFLEGLAHWAIPEKTQKGGLEDILGWKRPLEYLNLSLYPWKFQTKWSFTPGNSKKMYCTHSGISNAKNQDPQKFHMIFSWSPLEFPHSITPGNSMSS